MSNTIGRLDFEITSMDKGNSVPFDPYVRLCLKQYGATTRDGAPTISANLMTVQEIDEHVAMLKADLDAVARKAKSGLSKAQEKTQMFVSQRAFE